LELNRNQGEDMKRSITAVFLIATAACSQSGAARAQDNAQPPQPQSAVAGACAPLARIDSTSLLRDLERLAHDSMAGRLIGSPGAIKARDYLAARFDAVGLETPSAGRLQRIPVSSQRLPNVDAAWNVLGIVRGTARPERWIVITAHYDHVGIGRPLDGDSIYNGSDDNASGASALVVMGQYFKENPLGRSILFAAVDGEERGMWGSRGLVESLPMPIETVDLNINLDMVSRNERQELYAAGPGRYPQLTAVVEAVQPCAPVRLMMGHDTPAAGPGNDWTGQSDHAAFHAKGIPFLYFGVEDHPDYHRPGDHAERAMPGFYVNAVRTIIETARRFDAR
jgi:Zn-dependent M28 family amino/carboxypeptidase